MIRSHNEVVSTAAKALRGASFATGVSDELAQATLWLCLNGFSGVEVLLEELASQTTPLKADGSSGVLYLSGAAGLCAISAVDGLRTDMWASATITAPTNPQIVLGVCGHMSAAAGDAVEIANWAILDGGALNLLSQTPPKGHLILRRAPNTGAAMPKAPEPFEVSQNAWQALEALAAKTYVPASQSSRESGAGADISDND